jgi:hypothetical protein
MHSTDALLALPDKLNKAFADHCKASKHLSTGKQFC